VAGAAGGLPELHYQSQFHSNRRYGGDWYYKFGERDGFLRLGVDTVRTYGGQAGLLPLVGLRHCACRCRTGRCWRSPIFAT
jgi:hypothetical protein